jgi:hypothetical protein
MNHPFEQFIRHYHPRTTDPDVLRAWQMFTLPLDQRHEHATIELLRWLDMVDPSRGVDDYQFAEEGFITLIGDGLRVETPVMEYADCSRHAFRNELVAFIAAYEIWRG